MILTSFHFPLPLALESEAANIMFQFTMQYPRQFYLRYHMHDSSVVRKSTDTSMLLLDDRRMNTARKSGKI